MWHDLSVAEVDNENSTMNFMYYKGFSDEKPSSSFSGYKKKAIPRKSKGNIQHGQEGHAQGCDCEVCASEFPLRTHPFLDMSYSRLNQDQKPSSTSKFSFFSRKKPSSHTPAHTAAALALAQEQRRASARAQLQAQQEAEAMARALQEPVTLGTLKQDSLMIPVAKMKQFFPAGHPIPTIASQGRLRLLEAPEHSIHVVFHMMGSAVHVNAALRSPLLDSYAHQRECVVKAFKAAVSAANVGAGTLQGMVLLNLERGGEMGAVEFPFMIVWFVDGRQCDANQLIGRVRQSSLETLDPMKTGFTCSHYFDTFEEVATLARPPLERMQRKPSSAHTGYIITVFRVFEGNDGVKFERNWLGWTGARTLYKSLTSEVGLKRITLHKSSPQNGTLHYVLMCDCTNFLTCFNKAVKAVPSLRMRLCGDTGLYRPICSL